MIREATDFWEMGKVEWLLRAAGICSRLCPTLCVPPDFLELNFCNFSLSIPWICPKASYSFAAGCLGLWEDDNYHT